MKTIAEQIQDLENTRAAKAARMEEITNKSIEAGRTKDQAEKEEFDEIREEIKNIDVELVDLHEMEKMFRHSAQPVIPNTGVVDKSLGKVKGPTIITNKTDPDEKFQGQGFTRLCIAKALARETGVSAAQIAHNRWGKTHPNLVEFIKADVAGLGSSTGEAGANASQSVPYNING